MPPTGGSQASYGLSDLPAERYKDGMRILPHPILSSGLLTGVKVFQLFLGTVLTESVPVNGELSMSAPVRVASVSPAIIPVS